MQAATPFDEFVSIYVRAIRSRLRSANQVERRLNRFVIAWGKRPLDTVRRRDVADYVELRQLQGVSPASINIEIANLSAAINYVRRRYELDVQNPVTGLFFPQAPGRLRYLEREEAARLVESSRAVRAPLLSDFIQLALHTGCRKNELLLMRWKSVDLSRLILTVEAETTKTGKRRHLPINQTAHKVLLNLSRYRERISPDAPWVFIKSNGERWRFVDRAFTKAVELAELEDFHVHDLRHTFASWLVSEGVELVKVRDLLGHASIRMTERYAHLAPFRLHEAVGVLDGLMAQRWEQTSMF